MRTASTNLPSMMDPPFFPDGEGSRPSPYFIPVKSALMSERQFASCITKSRASSSRLIWSVYSLATSSEFSKATVDPSPCS